MKTSHERVASNEFTYTRRDYVFDVGCLVAFTSIWCYVLFKLFSELRVELPTTIFWYGVPAAIFLAALAADFLSGFVHFVADNFFSPDTPIVGRAFIQPFREHHDLPMKITEHSFAELNGNSAFLCLPLLLIVAYPSGSQHSAASQLLVVFILFFSAFVVVTNKIHSWAHAPSSSSFIATLQRWNLIISPQRHACHHTFPYQGNYCITLGLLNPLLDRLGFFTGIKSLVGRRKRPKDG